MEHLLSPLAEEPADIAPGVYKRPTRLADGRELIYYDEKPNTQRVLTDPRELPEVHPAAQARYDALLGEWVGIAGHRQTRIYHPPANACPLCPSRSDNASEIPSSDYDVVVFANRFPSFAGVEPIDTAAALMSAEPGHGQCEVVCFTSDHNATFSALPPRRVATVLTAWIDRTIALAAIPSVAQVFCFENRGADIGVTLAHPHGQIYGYPFITPKTAATMRQLADYRARTDRNLYADVVAAECAGNRVIARNEHWVAFVPFAARWPYEIHLYPLRQIPDLPSLSAAERAALPEIYLEVLHRLEGVFPDSLPESLPAITGWHQAPLDKPHVPLAVQRTEFWMHAEIFTIRRAEGKLKYLAGSESAMGAFINDISPELAAERLREVSW